MLLGSAFAEAQRSGFIVGIAPVGAQGFAPGFAPGFATPGSVPGVVQGVFPGVFPGIFTGPAVAPGIVPVGPGFFSTVNPPIVIPGFNQPMVVPFNAPVIVTNPSPFNGGFSQQFAHRQLHFTGTPHVHVVPHNFGVPVVSPGVVIIQPPVGHFGSPVPSQAIRSPEIGTSRVEVLRALGSPAATVLTRDGEILHYNGGITVFIQNGQVARPIR